jgi:hypothetical protein
MRTALFLCLFLLLPFLVVEASSKDGHPFAGRYTGMYTAAISTLDAGTWEFTLGEDGRGEGLVKSTAFDETYAVKAQVMKDGKLEMVLGAVESGASFRGRISRSGQVFGVWENPKAGPAFKGTFKGHRSDDKLSAPKGNEG